MLDTNKLKYLKYLAYVLLVVLAAVVGIGIGQSTSGKKAVEATAESGQLSQKPVLKQQEVEDFLLHYYTKKDLGENRKRYKEFMTDTLYQQVVAEEEEPTNQTYKGFVVDYEFKSAIIYIDETTSQAIVQVDYINTLLDEKKNYNTAQKGVLNKTTLRLSYAQQGNELKVNRMEPIVLTDQTGDYGTLDSASSSEPAASEPQEPAATTETSTEEGSS